MPFHHERATAAAQYLLGRNLFPEAVLVSAAFGVTAAMTAALIAELTGSLWVAAAATAMEVLAFPRTYSYPKILVTAAASGARRHFCFADRSAMLRDRFASDPPSRVIEPMTPFFRYLDRCTTEAHRLFWAGMIPEVARDAPPCGSRRRDRLAMFQMTVATLPAEIRSSVVELARSSSWPLPGRRARQAP